MSIEWESPQWWKLVQRLRPKKKAPEYDEHEYAQCVRHAVKSGKKGYLCALLNEPGDICSVDGIAHLAVEHRQLSILHRLIQSGISVNQPDRDNRTPLHTSAAIGSKAIVDLLLHYKATLNVRDTWGRTPLMLSVINGKDVVTKRLIEEGANINIPDMDGKVPIHILTSYRKKEMLLYFLNLPNIYKNARDRRGRTPVDIAKILRDNEMLQFLSDAGYAVDWAPTTNTPRGIEQTGDCVHVGQ